jgi:ABC-2 type transport system permease protein/oleandomycin transport system permease protein
MSASRVIADSVVMTKRNLLKYPRIPTLLVFSTIQPIMFVLLFTYVFGGAIAVPGGNYVDFLLPGIFVQTAVFGSTQTGVGLAEDMNKGLIERFRSLPMTRSAVLVGRTVSDGVRNLFVVWLMTIVGYLVGFRFHGSLVQSAAAIVIAVLFGFAFSWISAWIGMAVNDVETAQVAGFVWIFPLTFASSAFVPVESMPGWLQTLTKANPVTVTVDTIRALVLDTPVTPHLWYSLAWILGILIVFIPLAVRAYRRAV